MRAHGTGSIFKRNNIFYYSNAKVGIRKSLKTSNYKQASKTVAKKYDYLILKDDLEQQETLLLKYENTKQKIKTQENRYIPLEQIMTEYKKVLLLSDSGRNKITAFVTEKFTLMIVKDLFKWLSQHYKKITYMQEISPVIAQEYFINFAQRGLKTKTYNAYLGQLQTIWKRLSVRLGIKENPWHAIPKKRLHPMDEEEQGHRPFTLEELKIMKDKSSGWIKYAIEVGYYTALRLNDTITLKWSEFDTERKLITHRCLKTGKKLLIYAPEIMIPLETWKREQETELKKECEYVFQEQAEKYLGIRNRMDKPDQKLKPDIYHASKVFRKFLQYDCDFRLGKIGFHSLRVTHATFSRKKGISDFQIQNQLGHSDFRITEKHYIQPSFEDKYNDLIFHHKSLPAIGQEAYDEVKAFKLKILALNANTLPELKAQLIKLLIVFKE